jgi:hypothetical protein
MWNGFPGPATRSLMDKLLANPHSTLRRGSRRQNLRAQLERTHYDKGEKWWGSDGAANPNLTVQQLLLDGAEGKLVDSTAKDNRTDSHTEQPGMAIGKFFSGLDGGTVVDPPVASTRVLGSGTGRREERDCCPVPRPPPQSRRQIFFFFLEPASSTLNRHLILVNRNG